jgi:hypothetical protein
LAIPGSCTTLTKELRNEDDMTDLLTLPASSVPAAFDRGFLYSPTQSLTRYALDERYAYDYRPGDLFEPMPEAPRGNPVAYRRWWEHSAMVETPDFLGLRVGDTISMHSFQGDHYPATVTATYRHHASVRYPAPKGSKEPWVRTYVKTRNADGHWY